MRFRILGPTQVHDADGRQVPVGGPGVRALLTRLLIDAGRVVSTGRLITDLYGEQPPAGAANALQSQVSRLRRTLPPDVPVELHPAGYRLAVEPDDVDAHRFTRTTSQGRAHLASGDHPGAAALLADALALWRGPALADVTDAPFAPAETARWEELRLAAVEDRVDAQLHLGEAAGLIDELRLLVGEHPLRERLCGQLMRALHHTGRQADALAVFEAARRRLADELGADPSPALAAVHVAILRGELPGAPWPAARPDPAAAGTMQPRPLPGQLTHFLGRDEELVRVGKLLGEARLVTLTGPGGTGKTRLAIESAARQDTERTFVDLAPLSDGADLPHAVLGALGLRDAGLRAPAAGHPDPVARITAALDGRPFLLVLDNCEHVIGDAAVLTERLLSACPQLRILATSREPLGLAGEALCPLPGLAVPPPGTPPERVPDFPAVRLFLDRAASAAPGMGTGDRDDLDAIRRVCAALDGLPLAIELAAARLRTLPVAELAARLDDRFSLLSRGSRTAQPRHRTLRAVIEWSWSLLDGAEQELARRMSVFVGGADLPAVERVCDATVDVLGSLVDKSLVEASGGRYRMLETVRAYASQRLVDAGEADRLRRAHADYYLELAWTADGELRGAGQLAWLAKLDTELDNLHAVLRRAVAAGDVATALELVNSLAFYWWVRGLRSEAATLAGETLAVVGSEAPSGTEDQHAMCTMLASLGGPDDPQRHQRLRRAADIVFRLDGPPRQTFLFFLSSMVAGPPEGGVEEVRRLAAEAGQKFGSDPWMHALAPVGLAMVLAWEGDLAQAEREARTSVERFRAIGERWGMATALGALAEIVAKLRVPAAAAAPFGEALALARELGSTVDVADLLRMRAESSRHAGDLAAAGRDYRQVIDVARQAGAPELLAAAHLGLALIAQQAGERSEAWRLANVALAECPTGWFAAEETRAEIRAVLAGLAGGCPPDAGDSQH